MYEFVSFGIFLNVWFFLIEKKNVLESGTTI